MNRKFPVTGIGILQQDTQKWYEAEQCWNCEPDQLRKMQITVNKPKKTWLRKRL